MNIFYRMHSFIKWVQAFSRLWLLNGSYVSHQNMRKLSILNLKNHITLYTKKMSQNDIILLLNKYIYLPKKCLDV